MRMEGMHTEDKDTKKALEGLMGITELENEADVVLVGGTEEMIKDYAVTKPEGGFNGITTVDDPYKFCQDNPTVKVLIKHGDGSFDRYNHEVE